MNAEIISVGTELLLGHTVNTDTVFVARELSAIGINLLFSCIVGDNPERLRVTVEQALERSDLVITTGGLGPTDDDLTKETVARAAGVRLVLDAGSLKRLEAYFSGRSMSGNQVRQAMLPEGCTVFANDRGTAPGCGFRTAGGKLVVMLPGPPSELVPMLKGQAIPFLMGMGEGIIRSKMIRTFGIGEGAAAEKLADLTGNANPTVATYASDTEMFVRVTAKAATSEEAERMCVPVVKTVRERLGDVVYGIDVDNLESVVVQELMRRDLCLSTAESCTGGLLAKRLTDIPGASSVFHMGVVTYANEIKALLLDVPEMMLREYGAVSEPVARAMAEGIRRRFGRGLGVGITGVAGPAGGTPEKPVGLIYLALSDGRSTWVRRMNPPARVHGRSWLRERAVSNALDMVRRYLLELPMLRCSIFSADGIRSDLEAEDNS